MAMIAKIAKASTASCLRLHIPCDSKKTTVNQIAKMLISAEMKKYTYAPLVFLSSNNWNPWYVPLKVAAYKINNMAMAFITIISFLTEEIFVAAAGTWF